MAITDFINEKVYPAMWDEIGSLFPEMGFKLTAGKWRSPKKIDGTDPKTPNRSKTIISPNYPSRALESGEGSIDLITLYMNLNNKPFWEALEAICKKLNLEIPTSRDEGKWKEYRDIREQRALSYDRQKRALFAPEGAAVLKYLKEVRGYSEELIKEMGLGYISPEEAKTLEEKGKVGMTCRAEDFPLSMPYFANGNVEGFNFRYISEEQIRKSYPDGTGKYRKTRSLNGIENKHPFGLLSNTLNKGTNRKAGIVVVEGELDALHAIAVGMENVIATSGGKLTPETIATIRKKGYKEITLILDTDGKGQQFTRESIENIHQAGLNSYVATLPDAKDVDEYLGKHSAEDLKGLIDKADHGSLYLFWKEAEAFFKTEQTQKDQDRFLESVIGIASKEIDPLKSSQILQYLKDKVLDQMGVNLEEIKKGIELKVAQQRREEENKRLTTATEAELKKASALLTEGKPAEAAAKVRKAEDILQNVEDREKYAKLLQDNTDELYESYKVAPKSLSTNIQLYTRDKTVYPLIFPSGAISIIGACTGHGKSKLLQSIALDALEQPEKGMILYLTYEESEANVNIQFLNSYANIEVTKKNASGNRGNLQTIREHLSNGEYNYFLKSKKYDPTTGRLIKDNSWIIPAFQKKEEEWKEIRKSGKIRLIKPEDNTLGLLKGIINYALQNPPLGLPIRAVFVDYVQELYLEDKDKTYGRVDELKKIMVDIDILAQEANIPIIMGAQLNRDTKNLKNLCNQVISDSGWIERKASEILLIWSSKEKGEALTEKDLEELGAVKKTDRGWETMKLGIDGELYLKLTKSRNIPTNTTAVLSINGNTGRVTGNAERRITAEEQSLDLSDGQEQQEPARMPLPPDYDPNPEDQYPRRGKYGNDEEEEIEHPGAAPDGLPF